MAISELSVKSEHLPVQLRLTADHEAVLLRIAGHDYDFNAETWRRFVGDINASIAFMQQEIDRRKTK